MGWQDAPIVGAAPAEPAASPAVPALASAWSQAPLDPTPPEAPHAVFSGSILPFSRYSDGSVGFDSNAGIVGQIKSALTLPRDVATGQVDPMSDEGVTRALGMAGMLSPVNPAVRAGDAAIPGVMSAFKNAVVKPPTAEALSAAGGAGFDAARDMGVEYASPAVADMASGVQADLNARGILPQLAPQTHQLLDALQDVPAGPSTVPFGNLDAARKAFGMVTQKFGPDNGAERAAAGIAKDAVTGFVQSADPLSVVSGPAADAAAAVKDAIPNSAAGFRSDRLNGIEDAAGLRTSAANSGANSGNSIRQRVASLLLSDKASSGYNPEELAALTAVTKGTPLSNGARTLGNLLAGGGGAAWTLESLGGAAAGYEMGGIPGAAAGFALPLVGPVAKAIDNGLTRGRLNASDELVRQRSPLYAQMLSDAPPVLDNEWKRSALVRALGATAAPNENQQ
jgi:hypothetical protein